jgi:hypothetical protein
VRLTYHPDAEAELAAAAQFYERKMPGLGTQFQQEFDSAIARILPMGGGFYSSLRLTPKSTP